MSGWVEIVSLPFELEMGEDGVVACVCGCGCRHAMEV